MKKLICALLILLVFSFLGCSTNREGAETLSDYLSESEVFESETREYGEEKRRVLTSEKLLITISYPKTNIAVLDNAIEKYIDKKIVDAQETSAEKENLEGAEILISYNSYVNENDIVSIEFIGAYTDSTMETPVDFVKTFVADIKNKKLLTIDDVIINGKREDLQEKLADEFSADKENEKDDLLKYWVIADDCLKFILPKGEVVTESENTQSYTFSKSKTEKFLKFYADENAEEENQTQTQPQTTEPTKPAIDVKKPMVALTFDDGPSAHTGRLLDVLNKYNSKATFFVVGNILDDNKETLKRIADEGHEIGSHTWSHKDLTTIGYGEATSEITKARNKIREITGVECNIVRPPYGACNDNVKAIGRELGVSYINWNLDTFDWKYKNADAVYKELMKDVADGYIILCHDLHGSTVDAMARVVPDLIKQGYQLVTVSELLTCKGGKMIPGEIYYRQAKQEKVTEQQVQ